MGNKTYIKKIVNKYKNKGQFNTVTRIDLMNALRHYLVTCKTFTDIQEEMYKKKEDKQGLQPATGFAKGLVKLIPATQELANIQLNELENNELVSTSQVQNQVKEIFCALAHILDFIDEDFEEVLQEK